MDDLPFVPRLWIFKRKVMEKRVRDNIPLSGSTACSGCFNLSLSFVASGLLTAYTMGCCVNDEYVNTRCDPIYYKKKRPWLATKDCAVIPVTMVYPLPLSRKTRPFSVDQPNHPQTLPFSLVIIPVCEHHYPLSCLSSLLSNQHCPFQQSSPSHGVPLPPNIGVLLYI